jgi:hypothetical protein
MYRASTVDQHLHRGCRRRPNPRAFLRFPTRKPLRIKSEVYGSKEVCGSKPLACLSPNLLRTGESEFVSCAVDEKPQHLVARNVILLVGQFSTSSSRNGNSHPLARNACKAQTNIRVANLERQPHHQSGSQLVIRNVPISSVSLRHSLHSTSSSIRESTSYSERSDIVSFS